MYLPCCGVKRVADTFVEVSLVFGVFIYWLTPIPLTVLCVSTCSDGLLDFHMLNVSRVFWLELDDKALLDSYTLSLCGFSKPFLFCAHAVRARSSDGHKNVLSLLRFLETPMTTVKRTGTAPQIAVVSAGSRSVTLLDLGVNQFVCIVEFLLVCTIRKSLVNSPFHPLRCLKLHLRRPTWHARAQIKKVLSFVFYPIQQHTKRYS